MKLQKTAAKEVKTFFGVFKEEALKMLNI